MGSLGKNKCFFLPFLKVVGKKGGMREIEKYAK